MSLRCKKNTDIVRPCLSQSLSVPVFPKQMDLMFNHIEALKQTLVFQPLNDKLFRLIFLNTPLQATGVAHHYYTANRFKQVSHNILYLLPMFLLTAIKPKK